MTQATRMELKKNVLAHSVIAALAVLGAGSATASGFQLLEQNASGLGNAYAGSAAVSENASTIFYNPAGMTQLQNREVSFGANLIEPKYKFTDNGSSNFPAATGSNGDDAGGLGVSPNIYGSMALTKDLYLGIGFSTPFGLSTNYNNDWVGRFQSLKFDIKTYNVNPSIAYRINNKFSVGMGADWQRMEVDYERMGAVVNAFTQSTRVALNATSESWGWNLGALFAPTEDMKMGLSYRSRVKHKLEGSLTSSNQLVSPDTMAEANITLPDTWIYSITQKIGDRWEILGDVSRTGWSSIEDVAIVRTSGAASGSTAQTLNAHFRNTWRVALGTNFKLNDEWKLKYGVAYDQTPVRGDTDRLTSLPDNNRVWFSVGTQWAATKTSKVDVGLAYLYVPKTKIDSNESATGQGHVVGEYSSNVFILGAQYSVAF